MSDRQVKYLWDVLQRIQIWAYRALQDHPGGLIKTNLTKIEIEARLALLQVKRPNEPEYPTRQGHESEIENEE